ncbi:MAG TPA: ribonuclease HII [Chthoniobacterales bacterium]
MPRSRRCSLRYENRLRKAGCGCIAGVDEVGRGPIAGPVIAAAVVLPVTFRLRGLTDSKQLSPAVREEFFARLTSNPNVHHAVGFASVAEIDEINILQAAHRAMLRALGTLTADPEHVLVDGLFVRSLPYPQTALVGGDALSLSIAAASVIAKVTRDRLMEGWHQRFPVYGFDRHKGYLTRDHFESLRRHGPCPIHRRSFAPVAQTLPSFCPKNPNPVSP